MENKNGFEVDDSALESFSTFAVRVKEIDKLVGDYLAQRMNVLLRQRYSASGIKNKTGALDRSISVRYDSTSNSIQVGTLIYGVFLSYGVGPKAKGGKVYQIDNWVLNSLNGTPRGGKTFSYEPSYRKFGIKARKWLPSDEALQNIINDFIQEYEQQV